MCKNFAGGKSINKKEFDNSEDKSQTVRKVINEANNVDIFNEKQTLLLDRVKMQWLFGDWNSLSYVSLDELEEHFKRDEIALLIGSAHQHIGNVKESHEFLSLSKKWGCSIEKITRVLSSDAHNTIARAAVISGNMEKAFVHFQEAVKGVSSDERLSFQARTLWEIATLRAQSESIEKITSESFNDLLVYDSENSLKLIQEDIGYFKQNDSILGYQKKNEYIRKIEFSTSILFSTKKININFLPINKISTNSFVHCDGPFVFFSLPSKNHIYLSSSQVNSLDDPPEKELLFLKTECVYCLAGNSAIFGEGTINLWLIEYSNEKRLCHYQSRISDGKFEIKWKTHPEYKKFIISLRLQGTGILLLSDLHLSEVLQEKEIIEPKNPAEYHANLSRDRIAQAYLGLWGDVRTQEKSKNRINWMASQVEGHKILDVGCSEGIMPILLGREGYDVLGIDVNSEALIFAQGLLDRENEFVKKRVRYLHADFIEADLEKQVFDTIIIGEVLEHLVKPELMLENVYAHLTRNGSVVITTPYGFFPHEDHKQIFSLIKFINLLTISKFAPKQLSIVDGYIRFVGSKAEHVDNRSWEEILDRLIIDIVEKETIEQQKLLWNRIKTITQITEETKKKVSKLENSLNFAYKSQSKLQEYVLNLLKKILEG